jgi:amino acid transporter
MINSKKGEKTMVKEKSTSVKPTLGLLGATMNAMALIAPGAFLWITYQMLAAAAAPSGASVATDIWAGIVVALIVALLTALSYSQLAKIYQEAGVRELCLFYRGCVA